MEAVLRAVAEPRRRKVVDLLRERPLPAGEIARHFSVTRPAISQHLRVLKEAGLVDERRNGTQRIYSLRPEGFAEAAAFLARFWDDRLPRLKELAEEQEKGRKS